MKDTSKEPWVENYPELKTWLDDHDAVCNWQKRIGSGGTACMVESWTIRGYNPFLVLVWANGNGWHIYTESSEGETEKYLAESLDRICRT